MSGTPFASLHHNIYPLMMKVLVVMNWLLEYVESGRGTCAMIQRWPPLLRSRYYDCRKFRYQGYSKLKFWNLSKRKGGILH